MDYAYNYFHLHRRTRAENRRSKYLDGDRWLDQPTAQEMPTELQAKWNDDYMGIYPEQLQARINSVVPKLIKRIKELEAKIH